MTGLLLLKQIHTVAVGAAIGHACLLLAAGTKGKRFMMPHAKGTKQFLLKFALNGFYVFHPNWY